MPASPLTKSLLAAYLPCAAAAVCLAAIYVHAEDPVYAWDWGMYWNLFRMLGGLASESAAKFLALTLQSISESDYNVSGLLPLLPVYWLLGSERVVYVAAICALYVVPAALTAAYLALQGKPASGPVWLAVISALLMPVFWNAALRGMIDPIGLIPLGLAANMLWTTRFLTQASRTTALRLGILLWLPFLLRRWYAFSLVALIGLSLAAALCLMVLNRGKAGRVSLREDRDTLGRWSIAGLTVILGLVLYQLPLVDRILHTDYRDIYSAYQVSPWEQISGYYTNFGPQIAAFLALGLAVDIRRRNHVNLFFFAVAVVTVLLFARVQAPGVQHYLPISLLVFPVCFSGISFAWQGLSSPWRLAVPLVLVLNFANTYVPPSTGSVQAVREALGGPAYPPLRLDRYADYVKLTDDLLALGDNTRIAVFASSLNLSGSLLTAVNPGLRPRMIAVGEVDLRDRFPWDALDADYVIIGHPTQIHLDPQGQRVIAIPAEEIAAGTGIGASFESTGHRYELANGVTGEVYHRFRPIPAADLAAFKEQFYQIYPQWRADDAATPAPTAQ